MRSFSLLPLMAVTALSLSACGGNDDTGYLGSRDDIIITNRNMPKAAETKAPEPMPEPEMMEDMAKGEIATVKMDAEEKAEAARIAAQEKAIEEAKAEALKPIEGRDAEQAAKIKEAEEAMAKQAAATKAAQETTTTAPKNNPTFAPPAIPEPMKAAMAKEPAPQPAKDPAMQRMGATNMTVPPEYRKPVQTAAQRVPMAPVDNTGDVPPNAKPGECYAKVLIPAVTETVTENVQIAEEQEVLARIVPAQYKIEKEQVLVREARQYWKPGTGPKQRVDQTTGEIMCLVEEPAVYKTIERRVLVEPEKPEYKTVPAQFEKLTKTVIVQPERKEWRRILCETNLTPATIAKIQQALNAKGFDVGPIDGQPGNKTMSALNQYQLKNGLASRGITYETLEHLGVSLAGA